MIGRASVRAHERTALHSHRKIMTARLVAVAVFFLRFFIYQKQIETYKSITIKSILPVVVSHAKMSVHFFLKNCFCFRAECGDGKSIRPAVFVKQ